MSPANQQHWKSRGSTDRDEQKDEHEPPTPPMRPGIGDHSRSELGWSGRPADRESGHLGASMTGAIVGVKLSVATREMQLSAAWGQA
jgi:hypothetical protein